MRFPIQAEPAEIERPPAPKSFTSGPVAFILKRGVLHLGVIMFVCSTLYIYFVIGDHGAISGARLRITAPLCLFLGLGWGTIMWFTAQRQLERKS